MINFIIGFISGWATLFIARVILSRINNALTKKILFDHSEEVGKNALSNKLKDLQNEYSTLSADQRNSFVGQGIYSQIQNFKNKERNEQ